MPSLVGSEMCIRDSFYIERDSSSGEINRVEIKHIFTSTVTLVYPKESKKNG